MPAADFAAAQARIAARRQQRLLEQQRAHRSNARAPLIPSSNGSSGPEPSLRRTRQSPLDNLANTGLMVWDSIRGREGTKPAFRVGQVDAELLDEELLELLKGQVGEGMKYYGVGLPRSNKFGPRANGDTRHI
jgi:peroxin-2